MNFWGCKMFKRKRIIASLLSAAAITGLMSLNAKASTLSNRISGINRVSTSVEVANSGWTNSDYAVIAYAWDFPDAVSAAPLAYKYKAPILLTDKDELSTAASSELDNLHVKHVFIAGGTGVVSSKVESEISAKGIDIKRLSGNNRYETSIAIANQVGTNGSIVITNGYNPYEALSISPIAAKKGMPIILTAKSIVPTSVENYIKQNNITQTYILGKADGASEDDGVADGSVFPNPVRITGSNTYERNINIIKMFDKDIDYSKIYLATGRAFADALSGSALAAATSSPIIFVDDNMPQITKDFISSKATSVNTISILGGTGAIADNIVQQVKISLLTPAATPITLADGSTYIGELKDGFPDGLGTSTAKDGSKYEGEWKQGKKNGQGTLTQSSGLKYIGEFENDIQDGQGTYTWPDGQKYVGEFKNNYPFGQGTFTWPNGQKYVGEFEWGDENGQGTLILANGTKYIGEFKDNKMNGQGVITFSDGDKFEGIFENNKIKTGTYTHANGVKSIWKDGNVVNN